MTPFVITVLWVAFLWIVIYVLVEIMHA